ncbi:hypothetical protein E8D34_10690 [Nocardioides sp. GY 10113]|uniref:VRR-NUC domain-containing protein n=1 Tax=Nocardioides sp. GY 10113 TaxID=2569761 RepID=UPI0010A84CBF|nr:VRR-NUC domain-containing protein [Nocardioides sp. GY 10113]TIC86710.1 hypothetical protein E8D34_10690 [Nocardioides sp. GY 10113]
MSRAAAGLPGERTLAARYVVGKGRGRRRLLPPGSEDWADALTVEDWVARHFVSSGKVVLRGEYPPFGHLLGGLMHPVLPLGRIRYSDDPDPWPSAEVAAAHIRSLPDDSEELLSRFIANRSPTVAAREMLARTAHPLEDLAIELTAALLLGAMSAAQTKAVLSYLIEDYWGRRAGWPDLIVLAFSPQGTVEGLELVEVKSHSDRLGRDQRAWFLANDATLHLPAGIVRVTEEGESDQAGELEWPYAPPQHIWVPEHLAEHPLLRPAIAADQKFAFNLTAEIAERRTASSMRQHAAAGTGGT